MTADAELDSVVDARRVQTVFQPLVHLEREEVVGYEALTRGPSGTGLESPLELLAAARRAGRLDELDWTCAAKACEAAVAAQLHPSMTVFLNFEPSTLLAPCPEDLLHLTRRAQDLLRVIVEMKEDSLIADPGRTFDALARAREIGWGVAIDNASARPSSLALLPLVHPDVIKLDLRGPLDLDRVAEMADAARLYAERTGASVLAQGLEEADDLALARAAGAEFGQGFYFGAPGPLPEGTGAPRAVFPLLPAPELDGAATPFDLLAERSRPEVTEERFLSPIARYLEEQVDANGPPAVLLVSFPLGRRTDRKSRERLLALSRRAAFTVALGDGLGALAGPGLRTSALHAGDPMSGEWDVVVLGPHYCGALVTREAEGAPRRFAYAVHHDRGLVWRAARAFLRRLEPAPLAGTSVWQQALEAQ